MRVLDLFSGIGGFSLGLERAGMQTVAFCEIDPFCRAVLKKHWPAVPVFDDIRTLRHDRFVDEIGGVDLVCGGFPCQNISLLGNQTGLGGADSGLWFEQLRVVTELDPQWVVVENVAALVDRGLVEVLRGLAGAGFDSCWFIIPASSLGAPHRRERLWIIANARRARLEGYAGHGEETPLADSYRSTAPADLFRGKYPAEWWQGKPAIRRVVDGIPDFVDRITALGNAVIPQIPEMIGRAIMEVEVNGSSPDQETETDSAA
jgi:DNA (cytosine-5)-methyltransferase 1